MDSWLWRVPGVAAVVGWSMVVGANVALAATGGGLLPGQVNQIACAAASTCTVIAVVRVIATRLISAGYAQRLDDERAGVHRIGRDAAVK
ncbi:MAG TPA: hypothetical protein VIR27_15035 [Mycobacteriales bacterium]|jgi:hypothetical protein